MCADVINFSHFGDITPRKQLYFSPVAPHKKEPAARNFQIPKLNLEDFKLKNENIPQYSAKQQQPAPRKPNPRFSHAPETARVQRFSGIIPNAPISTNEAIDKYSSLLTNYERTEILNYAEIFYLGLPEKKIRPTNVCGLNNHGYDDDEKHYKAIIGDHIAYRYEIRAIFGKGAFGQVIRCFDHKTKKQIALKLVINTQQMHEQGLIEAEILDHLNKLDPNSNEQIVRGCGSFMFRDHVCITFEILGQNLYDYSRSIHFQPISLRQLKSIAKNMLSALMFCHKNGVIHCDMKPENVLFLPNSTMECKIIDFGSSCFNGHQKYEYIQSRFYRAPEVILGIRYGPPMDIWSFACIIIEMMIGRPIFAGDNEQEQIEMIMEVLGAPPRSMILVAKRRNEFFDNNCKPLLRNRVRHLRVPGSKNLRVVTGFTDQALLDLLQKCLEWDPNKRITAEEALNHPYFNVVKTMNRVPKTARSPSARGSTALPGLSARHHFF